MNESGSEGFELELRDLINGIEVRAFAAGKANLDLKIGQVPNLYGERARDEAAIVAAFNAALVRQAAIHISDLSYAKGQLEGLGAQHNYVDTALKLAEKRLAALEAGK